MLIQLRFYDMGSKDSIVSSCRGASPSSCCRVSLIKPSGRHSRRIRESITEVCGTLRVTGYVVTHFERPTCAIVHKSFSSRRRAYVYISEMLSLGVIREGDFVDISTETIVEFK